MQVLTSTKAVTGTHKLTETPSNAAADAAMMPVREYIRQNKVAANDATLKPVSQLR